MTYDKCSESNIASFTDVIERHDHEEADTLLVLHCFDIAQRDPLTNCTVFSPDTDVFLLLIHFYPSLPQSLLFHTGKGKDVRKIDIGSCYEGLGINHARALLGFHVFTGCDQTGRFAKKSKQFWWKEFRKADENTLNALAQLGKGVKVKSSSTIYVKYFDRINLHEVKYCDFAVL